MPHQSSAPLHRRDGSLAHHRQTIIASAIWLALAGAFLGYSLSSGASPTETLQAAIDLLRTPFGPLIYILIYTLRPLAFFSAVIVTLIGGAIWGTVLGNTVCDHRLEHVGDARILVWAGVWFWSLA